MILIIANQIGRIHHAAGNKHLQKTRPTYCFVPEEFFWERGFLRSRYLASRWPEINAGANPLALGSHVIPDPQQLVNLKIHCPHLREFMRRIEQIAEVKSITAE